MELSSCALWSVRQEILVDSVVIRTCQLFRLHYHSRSPLRLSDPLAPLPDSPEAGLLPHCLLWSHHTPRLRPVAGVGCCQPYAQSLREPQKLMSPPDSSQSCSTGAWWNQQGCSFGFFLEPRSPVARHSHSSLRMSRQVFKQQRRPAAPCPRLLLSSLPQPH